MRVLIVDDSRLARLMLRKALPPELGADIIEAADGAEALRCIATNEVGLMLLDLTMPDRDGYQVLKELKESGRVPTPSASACLKNMRSRCRRISTLAKW